MEPFKFETPAWANTLPEDSPEEALSRSKDLASRYYALATHTGIHSMIEWCGVMGEYVKMLRVGFDAGIDPREIDQHNETTVEAPDYMIEYFCEKLGCQLKPFIRANAKPWREAIEKWFEE